MNKAFICKRRGLNQLMPKSINSRAGKITNCVICLNLKLIQKIKSIQSTTLGYSTYFAAREIRLF